VASVPLGQQPFLALASNPVPMQQTLPIWLKTAGSGGRIVASVV
jgi:hypothetical protein